jgi:hypothetical protein
VSRLRALKLEKFIKYTNRRIDPIFRAQQISNRRRDAHVFDLIRRLLDKRVTSETALLSVIFYGVGLDDRARFLNFQRHG